jgi:glycine amidinotransferase
MHDVSVIYERPALSSAPMSSAACSVNSWNEWDPLEEVIVGRLDGAVVPPFHVSVTYNRPHSTSWLHRCVAGRRYPQWMVRRAQTELDGFVRLLEAEGVCVRRPEPIDQRRRVRTRLWSSRGFCLACPRDLYLIVGDEIIETPTCWRSRHFEGDAYRTLFKEYFADGARWIAAPRPQLPDELFDTSYRVPEPEEPVRYITNEFEPVFDAADVARCGRDLFITRSNATNEAGIRWLRRHLGDRGLRLQQLESRCSRPMHIDTTFVPLGTGEGTGKSRVHRCRSSAADPEVLGCVDRAQTRSTRRPDGEVQYVQPVDQHQRADAGPSEGRRGSLAADLAPGFERLGFEPLPLPFLAYGPFGGAFHCATLDTRRRGALADYF